LSENKSEKNIPKITAWQKIKRTIINTVAIYIPVLHVQTVNCLATGDNQKCKTGN